MLTVPLKATNHTKSQSKTNLFVRTKIFIQKNVDLARAKRIITKILLLVASKWDL